jgi:SAM-dependent methyltransferase
VAGRTEYTFGDGATATDRMALVHAVFAAASVRLLARVPLSPSSIVDLGPGPGHTTEMLRARYPHAALVAVEQSPTFAALTRARVPSCEVIEGDVTTTPLPRADLVYCRLVLAHLPDVAGALGAWRAALSPRGLVVLDEVERIDSDDAAFVRYEEIVTAMVASRGATISCGPQITAALSGDAAVVHDEVVEHAVAPADAAAMFAMNLQTWRTDAWVRAHIEAGELDALAAALACPDERGAITWHLRQVIVGPPT